jgi:hypothetical protein
VIRCSCAFSQEEINEVEVKGRRLFQSRTWQLSFSVMMHWWRTSESLPPHLSFRKRHAHGAKPLTPRHIEVPLAKQSAGRSYTVSRWALAPLAAP